MDNLLSNSVLIFFPVVRDAGAVALVLFILFWLFDAFGELLAVMGSREE